MTFYIAGCDKTQSYSDFRPISFPKDNCDCAAIQSKLDQQELRFTQMLNLLNKLEQRVTELTEQVLNTTSIDPAQLNERWVNRCDLMVDIVDLNHQCFLESWKCSISNKTKQLPF